MKATPLLFSSFLLLLSCRSAPDLSEAEVAANKKKSAESFQLALQRSKEGKTDSAEAHFREALELDGSTLERHLGLAGFLARTGRNEEAFAVYRNALKKLGERPEIYEEMAFAHNEAGDASAAIAALKKALDLRAKLPDTPENREWMQRDREGIEGLSGAKK